MQPKDTTLAPQHTPGRQAFIAMAHTAFHRQSAEAHANDWEHDVLVCHLCPEALKDFRRELERAEDARLAYSALPWRRRLLKRWRP